jgi:hypothetical protein
MHGEDRIDQVAPKGPKPCEDAIFVRACKPRVADDVSDQDRGEFPDLGHVAGCRQVAGRGGFGMAAFPCCIDRRRGGPGMQTRRSVASLAALLRV